MSSVTCKATLRTGRRRNRRHRSQHHHLAADFAHKLNINDADRDGNRLEEKVARAIDELETSQYLREIKQAFLAANGSSPRICAIICYGIGSFDECVTARLQLALCVSLQEWLDCDQVFIYDPVFSADEQAFLRDHLQFTVIAENEECKRVVDPEQPGKTLFVMPHLDKPLFNNLLWANWHKRNLEQLMILGNSFSEMFTNMPTRLFRDEFSYIFHALHLRIVKERAVNNNFRFSDVFNDLSLHTFCFSSVDNVAQFEACYSASPPEYTEEAEAALAV